jgi:hypothetical protein
LKAVVRRTSAALGGAGFFFGVAEAATRAVAEAPTTAAPIAGTAERNARRLNGAAHSEIRSVVKEVEGSIKAFFVISVTIATLI